jgi:glycosyltransferase involved in cell wall biosynthesis
LSQRPLLTGSGVTLDALVRQAAGAGWSQHVVVGLPASDGVPRVGGLGPGETSPLTFEDGRLDYPVPGMSDVMPYRSTRFSDMTEEQLSAYRDAWRSHLAGVARRFRPDVIHSHHVWIVSSLLKNVEPDVPVVTQCHATGLRQMQLCPHLADEVRAGCARNDRFLALHDGDAREIARQFDVPAERIHVVGAGYRDDLFHSRDHEAVTSPRVVYVGKYSSAKGLPWLLDAVERLAVRRPGLELHVVGSGSGPEADALLERMRAMSSVVRIHGSLSQEKLAELLRTCRVFVLPSLYEGVPLVVVEALACGCRPVATDLPGVRQELAPHLGGALTRIRPPRLTGVDTPHPDDLPAFVDELYRAVDSALDEPVEPTAAAEALQRFTWSAVFRRVETVWRGLLGQSRVG